MTTPARLTLRVDLGPELSIGPGKVRLLEAVGSEGSITRAGLALGMSYRRAWLLVDEMNKAFREKVVETQLGGTRGGGAQLTPFGHQLLSRYRAIEAGATRATHRHLAVLQAALRQPAPTTARKRSPVTR